MVFNNATNYKPTQFNVITGSANNQINNVPPSATVGFPLVSAGVAAQPAFSLLSASAVTGSTTGVAPAAGIIGEYISTYNSVGVALTSTVTADVASIVLSAGVWDLSVQTYFLMSVGASTCIASLVPTSGTTGSGGDNLAEFSPTPATTNLISSPAISQYRVLLAAPATYFYTATAVFAAGTATAFGRISATRVG